MRTISISTELFAAIWRNRLEGEDTENDILLRLLTRAGDGTGGIYNSRYDVRFAPGFEVFRTYKGKTYFAVVDNGRWLMSGKSYPSLFKLSEAACDSRENPWVGWNYRDAEGNEKPIDTLKKRGRD